MESHGIFHAAGVHMLVPLPDGLLLYSRPSPSCLSPVRLHAAPIPSQVLLLCEVRHLNYCVHLDVLYLLCVRLLQLPLNWKRLKEGAGHIHYVSATESQLYGGGLIVLSNIREICFLAH